MYGYVIAIVLGAVLLVLAMVGLARGNAEATGHSADGKTKERATPVGSPVAPAADEPTPGRSVTASPQQVETAKKHTPPS